MPGKGLKCLKRFEPDVRPKLVRVAELRGETPKDVVRKFKKKQIKKIPPSILKHTHILLKTNFIEAGEREGMPFVRLENGRIFYGHPSRKQHEREYAFLSDKLSPCLTPATYLTAKDVAIRYLREKWYRKECLPGPGGAVVEVGAYVGHKTMRFVDQHVTTSGKVLAIEIMPENLPILKRNIADNGMEGVIDVMHCGVWKEPGSLQVKGMGRQRNSLVSIDHLDRDNETTVPTDTLDNILAKWNQPKIDFMIITVNGAEIEVLQGLNKELNRIKVLYIAAHFKRDGKPTRDVCREMLREKGCRILNEGRDAGIYAQCS
jgi:FkbM family methyltransferase